MCLKPFSLSAAKSLFAEHFECLGIAASIRYVVGQRTGLTGCDNLSDSDRQKFTAVIPNRGN